MLESRYRTRVICASGLLLSCLVFGTLVYAAPAAPAAALTPQECDSLYNHQLKLFQSAESPLSVVLKHKATELKRADSVRVQRQHCVAQVSRASFLCQMRSTTLPDLIRCSGDPGESSVTEQPKGAGEKTEPTEFVPETKVREIVRTVSPETCAQGYEHLLTVYRASPTFQKRADAERLLKHWESAGAREAFQRRCKRVFRVADLNCVLSAKDSESIQACLLSVGG